MALLPTNLRLFDGREAVMREGVSLPGEGGRIAGLPRPANDWAAPA